MERGEVSPGSLRTESSMDWNTPGAGPSRPQSPTGETGGFILSHGGISSILLLELLLVELLLTTVYTGGWFSPLVPKPGGRGPPEGH